MVDGFLGEVRMFAGAFAPAGWLYCDGQLLSIAQEPGLFAILSDTYGGDGMVSFALPDLRGRVPLHPGQGPGLAPRLLGEQAGAEAVALAVAQLPSHTHAAGAATGKGASASPAGQVWAVSTRQDNQYAAAADATMHPAAVAATGGGQPHASMPPYLGIHFIICVLGTFPTQA